MADQQDVRRIALALPETNAAEDHFAFFFLNSGRQKGLVWAWSERAVGEAKFFTEPHYIGFPAILVRLPQVDLDELEDLINDAWRCQAPRALVEAFERGIA